MAINRIVDAGGAPPGWEQIVLEPARSAMTQKATPEVLRLLATAGNDSDRDAAARYLADTDEMLRLGAAEGMRRSGRRRALVERASADPVIYPVAVAAIADQPATPAVMTALLDLPPRTEQADAWNAAMKRVLVGLAAKDLIAADERLAALAFVTTKTRIEGLRSAVAVPANGGDQTLRTDLLVRLADLLLAEGDSRGALRLLADERQRDAAPMRPRFFRAAVMEGEYEMAAKLEPAAETWLVLLEALARQSPRSARPLADEITQRFARTMSESERQRLTSLERSLAATGQG